MRTVGIIQSNYLPWRGYFEFIRQCDVFVFLDDVQYTTRDWRNRNKIKTKEGIPWISVPVHFSRNAPTSIFETPINYDLPWRDEHISLIKYAYAKAPFFKEYSEELFSLISQPATSISDLNIRLIKWVNSKLGITTELVLSSTLKTSEEKSRKLLDIVVQLDGDKYLSGPAAREYLQQDLFNQNNVQVEFKEYGYSPYPQLFGDFVDGLSIIDLLFNAGPDSSRFLERI